MERSSQYFIVTVVFGPAINTVVNVFPKLCSRYYMQSRSLLQNENKRPISNKRPVPISAPSPISAPFPGPKTKLASRVLIQIFMVHML